MSDGKNYAVYTVIQDTNEIGKRFWQRIGVAFINRDGSMNVLLNALPVNGRLHIREPVRREEATFPN